MSHVHNGIVTSAEQLSGMVAGTTLIWGLGTVVVVDFGTEGVGFDVDFVAGVVVDVDLVDVEFVVCVVGFDLDFATGVLDFATGVVDFATGADET